MVHHTVSKWSSSIRHTFPHSLLIDDISNVGRLLVQLFFYGSGLLFKTVSFAASDIYRVTVADLIV